MILVQDRIGSMARRLFEGGRRWRRAWSSVARGHTIHGAVVLKLRWSAPASREPIWRAVIGIPKAEAESPKWRGA
jgi:hypothetical protein